MGILDSINQLQGLFRSGEEAGITDEVWERFRSDEAFRQRIAHQMKTGGFDSADDRSAPWADYGLSYPDFLVFGADEWDVFCEVASSEELMEANDAFPWVGENSLQGATLPFNPQLDVLRAQFNFLVPDGINAKHDAYAHEPFALDMSGIRQLSRSWMSWRRHPEVVYGGMGSVAVVPRGLEELPPPAPGWCGLLMIPFREAFSEIPPKYEVASVTECLLGLCLYYQKYGDWFEMGGRTFMRDIMVCADWVPGSGNNQFVVHCEPGARGAELRVSTTYDFNGPSRARAYMLKRRLPV
jgi:hypothetical protein